MKTRGWNKAALTLLFGWMPITAVAHDEPMNLDELMSAFGWDFAATEITTEKVTDGLYVLFGIGGNIGVSVGPQGVLIVDDQFPQMIPKVGDAIRAVRPSASVALMRLPTSLNRYQACC